MKLHTLVTTIILTLVLTTSASAQEGPAANICGGLPTALPFTDLGSIYVGFCPGIEQAFWSGLTTGTTATTYSPSDTVTRDQMATFITRTLNQGLDRNKRRAALNQWWTLTPRHTDGGFGLTQVGVDPAFVVSDGADVWVANKLSDTVSRVRASDGKLLETWSSIVKPVMPLSAMGLIFVTSSGTPGKVYGFNPSSAPSTPFVAATVGNGPAGIAFDGEKLWVANSAGNSVSILTPSKYLPWPVTTVGGFTSPSGIIFDGANIWVTAGSYLYKLDSSGNVLQSVNLGSTGGYPVFDGKNIWVPSIPGNSIIVVRAATATVLTALAGNGLAGPKQVAFDGERILAVNTTGASVSLWNSSDLSELGTFSVGAGFTPNGVCSDGLNFWISLDNPAFGYLARY